MMPSMTKPSGYVLEVLREGADFTLYRGRQQGNPAPVLVVALTAEQPSSQSLRRLEHEYSLAAELDPAWAAKPLALTRHEGRTILVLADPGGEPLDLVLERGQGQPPDLARVLRIAIGLAAALGQVHRRGLIHKDIKPANVLVDDAGNVWLTGFGIASQLPRESQAPSPPEIIGRTLAYMAPEQTGRMNRSIDTRSDFYSLGVTLYQMLTGGGAWRNGSRKVASIHSFWAPTTRRTDCGSLRSCMGESARSTHCSQPSTGWWLRGPPSSCWYPVILAWANPLW